MTDDTCIYCNLKLTVEMLNDTNDTKGTQININKMYPCITENELIIKKALE